jgi:hypothetical protein
MRIQSFREYCLSLDESLDTPYPWKTVGGDSDNYRAMFTVPATSKAGQPQTSLLYQVDFVKHTEQSILWGDEDVHPWNFSFELAPRAAQTAQARSLGIKSVHGITQTGHAFTVFATVIDVMKAFVARQHPSVIYFSAYESSRAKLYDRFITQVGASVPGYVGHKLTAAMRPQGGWTRLPTGRLATAPDWIDNDNYVIAKKAIPLKTILTAVRIV